MVPALRQRGWFPQQVVAIATGSHVVMVAIEGRAVAVGNGGRGEERGGEGCIESSGGLLIELIRSQLQRAAVSWHLVKHTLNKHTLFTLCTCVSGGVHVTVAVNVYAAFIFVCVDGWSPDQMSTKPITEMDISICLCLLGAPHTHMTPLLLSFRIHNLLQPSRDD